jgi:hypothetical protein
MSLVQQLTQDTAATKTLIDDFLLTFSFQPAGWLHLERLEMNPVGIEDGELVYSVPLTPKETVNITHREWSQTTSTFETLVSDIFEGFSEKGVTNKTDVATALSNEDKHSSAFDVNGQVSFSYSGNPYSVTTSAGVDYSTKADADRSVKDSQAHSLAITQTASARTRREHKQSFRVSSVAGSQDLSVRILTNPSDSQTMRADYFRMMRRWQVDLIRYGLRMTYDLVIPNPGYALAGKVMELKALTARIAADYVFDLTLSDITPLTWQDHAQSIGADVDPPPAPVVQMMQSGPLTQSIDKFTFSTLMFNIPDGYAAATGRFTAQVHIGDADYNSGHRAQIAVLNEAGSGEFPNKDGSFDIPLTPASIIGRTGNVALMYLYNNVESGGFVATVDATPTKDSILAWQVKALNQLRQADEAAFAANIQKLKERNAQLEAEIANYDSLTLRRMEREEIMRLVLQWIFGPSFQLVPTLFEQLVWPNYLNNPPAIDPNAEFAFPDPADIGADWDSVRKYGEFIKFLNNAIEWENVLFFCYPYFWDLVENWPFKRFLVHPDPDHRVFLRAGCARVVLTVRPGFETQFAGLVDYFTLPGHPHPDPNAPPTPYVTIGQEIQNYAMTNYSHVPPANPDNNVRPQLYPLQIRAWKEMQDIMTVLEAYNKQQHLANPSLDPNVKIYPQTLSDKGFTSLVPLADASGNIIVPALVVNDPWKRPYVYSSPGEHGEDYDLVTYGASGDSKVNGDELDAWITSWAEGNIVSRWYEYTPTSALDVAVAFNPPQPVRF